MKSPSHAGEGQSHTNMRGYARLVFDDGGELLRDIGG